MDWGTLTADVELLLPTHYTPGRAGQRIRYVVIHHNAGRLSARGIYDAWLVREASAHYQVDVAGLISQHVNDADTAWHAGDQLANQRSIGIEHANSSGTTGPLSAATLDAGAHLTAAVCARYGLGRPEWGVNVYPHNHFYPTACPGTLAGAQRGPYMSAAQRYYDQMTGAAPAITTQEDDMPYSEDQVRALVQEGFLRIKWGDLNMGDLLLSVYRNSAAALAKAEATQAALAAFADRQGVDSAPIVAAIEAAGVRAVDALRQSLDGATVTLYTVPERQGGGR